MGNEIVKVEKATKFTPLSKEEVGLLVSSGVVPETASIADASFFFYKCQALGLNPATGGVVMVGFLDRRTNKYKYAHVTTIGGYRDLAKRTGEFKHELEPMFDSLSIEEWIERNGMPLYQGVEPQIKRPTWKGSLPSVCSVKVIRKSANGTPLTFKGFATWESRYKSNSANWNKDPFGMLAKCASAAAIRIAFPEAVAGLYTREEMHGVAQSESNEMQNMLYIDDEYRERAYNFIQDCKSLQELAQAHDEFKEINTEDKFLALFENRANEIELEAANKPLEVDLKENPQLKIEM